LSIVFFRKNGQAKLRSTLNGTDMLIDGKTAPEAGEVFVNQKLANVLKVLGKEGKQGFYEGWIGKAIVDVVQASGGSLEVEDLASHKSEFVDPISVQYKGVDIYEIVSQLVLFSNLK
jgi:gamma-glutamyltranspeptidase/glutathione hydrolase